MDKIEDFGVHCKKYYPLDISYFKSETDQLLFDRLWNTYWVNTLSSNPLLTGQDHTTKQMQDVASKLAHIKESNQRHRFTATDAHGNPKPSDAAKCCSESCKLAHETLQSVLRQGIKRSVFATAQKDVQDQEQ